MIRIAASVFRRHAVQHTDVSPQCEITALDVLVLTMTSPVDDLPSLLGHDDRWHSGGHDDVTSRRLTVAARAR